MTQMKKLTESSLVKLLLSLAMASTQEQCCFAHYLDLCSVYLRAATI